MTAAIHIFQAFFSLPPSLLSRRAASAERRARFPTHTTGSNTPQSIHPDPAQPTVVTVPACKSEHTECMIITSRSPLLPSSHTYNVNRPQCSAYVSTHLSHLSCAAIQIQDRLMVLLCMETSSPACFFSYQITVAERQTIRGLSWVDKCRISKDNTISLDVSATARRSLLSRLRHSSP